MQLPHPMFVVDLFTLIRSWTFSCSFNHVSTCTVQRWSLESREANDQYTDTESSAASLAWWKLHQEIRIKTRRALQKQRRLSQLRFKRRKLDKEQSHLLSHCLSHSNRNCRTFTRGEDKNINFEETQPQSVINVLFMLSNIVFITKCNKKKPDSSVNSNLIKLKVQQQLLETEGTNKHVENR